MSAKKSGWDDAQKFHEAQRLDRLELREIIEFAEKVAKAMDNLRTNHVFFILQKAYRGTEWEEAQDILNRVIVNAPKALYSDIEEAYKKGRYDALEDHAKGMVNEIEEAKKQERERILKIYKDTISICPDAGLVSILQALKEESNNQQGQ